MNMILLIKALIAKLGEHAIKMSPLLIIIYAIYNMATNVLGYMTLEEHKNEHRDTIKYRKNTFIVGMVMSGLVILISSIYFYTNLKL